DPFQDDPAKIGTDRCVLALRRRLHRCDPRELRLRFQTVCPAITVTHRFLAPSTRAVRTGPRTRGGTRAAVFSRCNIVSQMNIIVYHFTLSNVYSSREQNSIGTGSGPRSTLAKDRNRRRPGERV